MKKDGKKAQTKNVSRLKFPDQSNFPSHGCSYKSVSKYRLWLTQKGIYLGVWTEVSAFAQIQLCTNLARQLELAFLEETRLVKLVHKSETIHLVSKIPGLFWQNLS